MVTLSRIDDHNVNCTFIIYEGVRLLILLKRDPIGWRLLWSSVCVHVYRVLVKSPATR